MKIRSAILEFLLADRWTDRYGEAKWRTIPAFRFERIKRVSLYMCSPTYFITRPIRLITHVCSLYEYYVVHCPLSELGLLQPTGDHTISTGTKIKSITNLSVLRYLNHMKTGVEPTPGTSYYNYNLWFTFDTSIKILQIKCNIGQNIFELNMCRQILETDRISRRTSITLTVLISVCLSGPHPLYLAVVTSVPSIHKESGSIRTLPLGLTLKITKTKTSISIMIINNSKGEQRQLTKRHISPYRPVKCTSDNAQCLT
jgi:hypothetical protein